MDVIQHIAQGVLSGDKRSAAKAITMVERGGADAKRLIALLYPHTGRAHVIGVTGPAGSGKSTLIEKLVKELRKGGKTVGIIAVDPSSPFSGGAFLGDRIRMQSLAVDDGVFIRSMATRGHPGGLARATKDAVKVLDAFGKDFVIVETVGAGQDEVDVFNVAHTVIVVLAPGLGDDVQTMKAGLMEVADVFVVNKADRENADSMAMYVEEALRMGRPQGVWRPPVLKTVALTGEGVSRLLDKILKHKRLLDEGAYALREIRIVEAELIEAIGREAADIVVEALRKEGRMDEIVKRVLARDVDPYSAVDELMLELSTALRSSLMKTKKEG